MVFACTQSESKQKYTRPEVTAIACRMSIKNAQVVVQVFWFFLTHRLLRWKQHVKSIEQTITTTTGKKIINEL